MIGLDPRLGQPREVDSVEITCEVTLRDDQARKLIAIAKRLDKKPVEAFADLVESMLGGPKREKPTITVPPWVPDDLHVGYHRTAEAFGEEAAAAWARARKRART